MICPVCHQPCRKRVREADRVVYVHRSARRKRPAIACVFGRRVVSNER